MALGVAGGLHHLLVLGGSLHGGILELLGEVRYDTGRSELRARRMPHLLDEWIAPTSTPVEGARIDGGVALSLRLMLLLLLLLIYLRLRLMSQSPSCGPSFLLLFIPHEELLPWDHLLL